MGYTTDFEGSIKIKPAMAKEHVAYINKFSETRRMDRNEFLAVRMPDPVREAAGLPVGQWGQYFVGGGGFAGQDRDESITNYNAPPSGQPGLWCQWVVNDEGTELEWNQCEKFYEYALWMEYLMQHFFTPWGYKCNGAIEWQGEESSDIGRLHVKDNQVQACTGRVAYDAPKWEES